METPTSCSLNAKLPKKSSSENISFRSTFFLVFKYPIFFLNLGGFRVPAVDGSSAPGDARCSAVRHALDVIYRVFLVLLHVVNAGRVIGFWVTITHDAKETDIARSLLASSIMLYGSTLFVCDHLAIRFYFNPLLKALEVYNEDYGFLCSFFKNVNRVKCFTLFVIVFNLVSIVFWAALDATNSDRFVTNPFEEKDMSTLALVCVHLVFFTHMFLMNIPIYGCLLMYTLILGVLHDEFRCTTKMMKDILKGNDDTTESQFDRCSERHESLCQMVSILSKLTRTYVGINIFYNMVIACVSIYGLSSADLTGEFFIFQFISGVVVNSCIVLFLTGRWGQLSTAAHSITDAITNWSQASNRLLYKMTLLVAHCSSSKIGVDVYGLFTLDSSTPLMVTGTLVTYGVVVLQFQLDHEIQYIRINGTDLS